jgi:hypothetical protein
MTDDRWDDDDLPEEDRLVDEVLRPRDSLGDKRPEYAHRRPPSTRRPGTPRRKPPGRGGGRTGRVLLWLLILAAVGGGSWFGWQRLQPQVDEGDFTITDQDVQPATPAAGDRAVVLVFPEWDATGYVTEERQIPSRGRGGEDLLGLMRVLCQGPVISGAVSAFPEGTAAKGAFYNPDDSSVVLDFSKELVTGHPGGSAAEVATLTSILRTVALNFPDTRSCIILVDGSQVETLAGHLTMDRPFDPRRWL